MKFKVYCQHEDFAKKLNFYIFSDNIDGSRNICTSIDKMEFKRVAEGELIPTTFSLSGHIITPFLQAMANTLKEIGIKADEEPILENELIAVKYHLEDMRKLVFKADG